MTEPDADDKVEGRSYERRHGEMGWMMRWKSFKAAETIVRRQVNLIPGDFGSGERLAFLRGGS